MILVDVNLLVDATMVAATDHEPSRAWLEDRLNDTPRVGLPWASITGFLRVATQPRAWTQPLGMSDAVAIAGSWLARPCTWIPEPGPAHFGLLETLLAPAPSSRLVTDAHLAALALEHGLTLCTRDGDFRRWTGLGLTVYDPVAR